MSLFRPLMLATAAALTLAATAHAQFGIPPVPQQRPLDISRTPQIDTALGDLVKTPAGPGEPLFGSFIGVVRVLGASSTVRLAGDVGTELNGDVVSLIEADDPDVFSLAVLRTLDKITARMSTQEVVIGETIELGNLRVTPRKCLKNPPTETPESSAFLDIYELPKESDPEPVFQGWMFASSPALNAMEHPVFDVWLLDCKN